MLDRIKKTVIFLVFYLKLHRLPFVPYLLKVASRWIKLDGKQLKELEHYDTSLNTPQYDRSVIGLLSDDTHTNKCLGTILGVTCGDILGANVEIMDAEQIKRKFGVVHSFIGTARRPIGQYTDDTEMTSALALSLVQTGKMDAKHCTDVYVRFYLRAPLKGYGGATAATFKKISQGQLNYKNSGTSIFPEGSFRNGGIMRIAPVGLAFRNAEPSVMREAVKQALMCTHGHPEAVDAAFLQARTIAHLCSIQDPKNFTKEAFVKWVQDLIPLATTSVVKDKVLLALHYLQYDKQDLEAFRDIVPSGFQIASSEALAIGFYAFGKYGITNPEEAVIKCVNWGGDADTEGAIVGALCGALHGTQWIPKRWFDNILETQHPEEGKSFVLNTAKELAKLDLKQVDKLE